jgi:glucosamine-6-phosphate deaminase
LQSTCLIVCSSEADGVRILKTANYETLSVTGADILASAIEDKPDLSVVAATGETPMGLYREFASRPNRPDTSRVRIFQLDEYLGLGPDDPRSLYGWMDRMLLKPLGIPSRNIVRLPGETPDPADACRRYEALIGKASGLDLAILGLGPNGHVGFNEPPSGPDSRTRPVDLAEESVGSNARYWGGRAHVPRRAMTAGMDVLLAARRILLVVAGAHKRSVLRRMLQEPVTPDLPASYLRVARDATVLADEAALGEPTSGSDVRGSREC